MGTEAADTLAIIKKDLRRIRRAGIDAEILGSGLLLLGVAASWFSQDYRSALLRFFGCFIPGIFLLLSGKYIKDGRGKLLPWALLVNSIVCFPLCPLVAPIYVCIESANNYSRFKAFPRNVQDLFNKSNPYRFKLPETVLLVGVVLLSLSLFGFKVYGLPNAKNAVASGSGSTQHGPVVNTAAKSHFVITFPGSIHETDLSEQVSGHTVPYVAYDSTDKNGGNSFVYVYSYPTDAFNYASQPAAALASTLHNSMLSIVQSLHCTLQSNNPTTFLNSTAVTANFTCPTYSGTENGSMILFFDKNTEYSIFTIGVNPSNYQTFINSFQLK